MFHSCVKLPEGKPQQWTDKRIWRSGYGQTIDQNGHQMTGNSHPLCLADSSARPMKMEAPMWDNGSRPQVVVTFFWCCDSMWMNEPETVPNGRG